MYLFSIVRWLAALMILVNLSACAPGVALSAESPTPLARATPTAPVQVTRTGGVVQPSLTPSLPTLQSATRTPQPVSSSPTPRAFFQGPLTVVLLNTTDNAVVQVPRLDLTGEADPKTVISFDDQFVVAGQNRTFMISLMLEEGPNVIEITASDLRGAQGTVYLTLIYDPQP